MIRKTQSVCPVCLKKVPAELFRTANGEIIQRKNCAAHGGFSVPVWKGFFDFDEWIQREPPLTEEESLSCGGNCKACGTHPQETCCVILEVTGACNLRCRYCFAHGGERNEMPSFETLQADIDRIVELAGDPLLQLAGGEPTLRDDLPALARYAKEVGCSYTQINTNGIRLAEDEAYVHALAEAGLDIVFLQFDGTDDAVYRKLRGRDLSDLKYRAIQNCDKYGIGVTLVPTIVRGINDGRIGEIVRTAINLFPAVRSVHFQPVTYLGRYPCLPELPEDRYTLDELMRDLVAQTGIPENTLLPSRCDHAACEFHSTLVIAEDGRLIPVSNRDADGRVGRTSPRDNRQYVAAHWSRSTEKGQEGPAIEKIVFGKTDELDFDTFIRYMRTRTLKISAMAFQDAANLDLERLNRCSLHVYENGKLLPFCGKYLTPVAAAGKTG